MIRTAGLVVLLAAPALAEAPMPFAVGGAYNLTDQYGHTRTEADPDGNPQLLFFGYANCPGICSAAMPTMAAVADRMAEKGVTLSPVMITVDPARDTVAGMGAPLAKVHHRFIGLTGTPAALQVAYDAFSVEHALAYQDPEYGPVYSHGSMIYLLDAQGQVLTLIPPVMEARAASDIAWKYLAPDSQPRARR